METLRIPHPPSGEKPGPSNDSAGRKRLAEPERSESISPPSSLLLEENSNVERYAYFNPVVGKPNSLIAKDGSLTRMIELYRDAGR